MAADRPVGIFRRSAGLGAALVIVAASHAHAAPGQRPEARRPSDIGAALLSCWQPPPGGGDITLSLAFRRDGTVIGTPRVTFARPRAGAADTTALKSTIAAALRACTPIPIAWPLRAFVAGQVLRIRFSADAATGARRVRVIWSGT